ncbi:hypothetical protein SEA_DIZZYRUDY_39 [Microbacterium phage DizzyRudy]|nr:hypothetical protein SEA_DIZZYRUDY_39 [Microbacterium phage DizzyRudy]
MTHAFQTSLDAAIQQAEAEPGYSNMLEFLRHKFGSEENYRDVAKNYVIVESPLRMEVDDRHGELETHFRFTHSYSIRHKTPAELAHDRAEQIIEQNTLKPCIVCGKRIKLDDLIPSQHGNYHSWCVGGK